MAITRSKKTAQSQRPTASLRKRARLTKTAVPSPSRPAARVEKHKTTATQVTPGYKAAGKANSAQKTAGKATLQTATAGKSTGAKHKSQITKPSAKKSSQRKPLGSWRKDTDALPADYYGILNLECPHIINKYLEVRETEAKGRGIFTRFANIPAGTLLLQEPFLLHNPNNDVEEPENIRKLVGALSSEDQRKFTALSHHSLSDTEEARYERNAFANKRSSHVWFWISLINHECAPNCSMMSAETGSGVVGNIRALKDLPKHGTEISIDYVYEHEIAWTVAQRRAHTQSSWGFECGCPTCRTPIVTNRAIAEMFDLKTQLIFTGRQRLKHNNIVNRQLVDAKAGRLFELLEHWGLTQAAYDLADDIVDFYSKIKDDLARAHAADWALHAVRVGKCIWGLESLEKPDSRTAVADIEGTVAPDPRFFITRGIGHSDWEKLVKKLPQLMAKQLYGNVRPRTGRDISDIPSELCEIEEQE